MRIGVFGGTFDPIHIGHLMIAEEARELLGLDEVVFIPAGQPWFKAEKQVTEACHRMAMVALAITSNPHFYASDIEMKRPGPSYTADTLDALRLHVPDETELFVILGLDSLKEVDRWYEPQRIFQMATVVGMSRPGYDDFDPQRLDSVIPDASSRIRVLEGPLMDISGTEIRRRVSEGKSIKYRVPESVKAYIHEHRLYRTE